MANKATSERRRWLHKALLTLVPLATVLGSAPVLAQDIAAPTGVPMEHGATPYQSGVPPTFDETSGTDYAPRSVVPNDYVDQPGAAYDTPDPGYQGAQLEGNVDPLNLVLVVPDPGPEPSSRVPPENQDPAQQAVLGARLAAQEAQLAAFDAQKAASTLQQSSAPSEDTQFAQEAAQETRIAASDAEEAAKVAQQAAAEEDAPTAQEAAQEAQQAAQEARQASGAVQQVAEQAAQQVVDNSGGADFKDAYTKALQAARSAGAKGDNVAFAAESSSRGSKANREKAASSSEEAVHGEASSETGTSKGAGGEAEPKEDANEPRSNPVAITAPLQDGRGGFPLLLGGGALLAAGVFVVRKILWS
jgi:hypothetical protein